MSKYTRHQSAISRNTDEHISEDHWLKKFESSLQKGAVQPRSQQSVYDQINSIMNGTKSKYTTVQSAVDDMMARSGLTNYLKVSNKQEIKAKTASEDYTQVGARDGKEDLDNQGFGSDILASIKSSKIPMPPSLEAWSQYAHGYKDGSKMSETHFVHEMKKIQDYFSKRSTDQNNDIDKMIPVEKKQQDTDTPDVMIENPSILKTLENCIKSNRGNLPVPTIISKLRSIHQNDISDDKKWDDDKLIRLVSKLNLEAKRNNPSNYENYNDLGSNDRDNAESDVDPSNTDAFNALMPAKI